MHRAGETFFLYNAFNIFNTHTMTNINALSTEDTIFSQAVSIITAISNWKYFYSSVMRTLKNKMTFLETRKENFNPSNSFKYC